MSCNVKESKLLFKKVLIQNIFTHWRSISNTVIHTTIYSQHKFYFIALLHCIQGILFVLLILDTVLYFYIVSFIFNCII